MDPYQLQRVHHVAPGDLAQRLEFSSCLSGCRPLHRYNLFSDEVQFSQDCVNLMCGQVRILTALWKVTFSCVTLTLCAVVYDQLVGPFIFESRPRGVYLWFLQGEMPQLRNMCLWINEIVHDSNVKKALLYFSWEVTTLLNDPFPGRRLGRAQLASQVSRFEPFRLLCMGMVERNCLQHGGWMARRIAWSRCEYGRLNQEEPEEGSTSKARYLQSSCEVRCVRE
jgi:hypothetical protein